MTIQSRTTMSLRRDLSIYYRFTLGSGVSRTFAVRLDAKTLALVPGKRETYPEWTALDYHPCEHCPLKASNTPRCPIAENLVDVVEFFGDAVSYEEAQVEVITLERTYVRHTALHDAISSLCGIVVASSGCPIGDRLRSNVRLHLPFANEEESAFLTLGTYLMAQFFRARRGLPADFALDGFKDLFTEVRGMHRGLIRRLQSTGMQDAILNAMVRLDHMAGFQEGTLRKGMLDRLERYFAASLD